MIASFDVATKSLALSLIEYYNPYDDISNLWRVYKSNKSDRLSKFDVSKNINLYIQLLDDINKILDKTIKIHILEVSDLIPNKKISETSSVERTRELHAYLSAVDEKIAKVLKKPDELVVLIEYQMNANDKSRTIAAQVMYHFTKYNIPIHYVGPSLKNKLFFKSDLHSNYQNFIERYTTNYAANKNHTKYLLKILLNKLGKASQEMISNIKKKNIDDIADSTIMSVAWYFNNR